MCDASGLICCLYHLIHFTFQEVVNESGKPKVTTTTIPSLAQPSIFHEVRVTVSVDCWSYFLAYNSSGLTVWIILSWLK